VIKSAIISEEKDIRDEYRFELAVLRADFGKNSKDFVRKTGM